MPKDEATTAAEKIFTEPQLHPLSLSYEANIRITSAIIRTEFAPVIAKAAKYDELNGMAGTLLPLKVKVEGYDHLARRCEELEAALRELRISVVLMNVAYLECRDNKEGMTSDKITDILTTHNERRAAALENAEKLLTKD